MFFLPLEGMILFRADETMASRGQGLMVIRVLDRDNDMG